MSGVFKAVFVKPVACFKLGEPEHLRVGACLDEIIVVAGKGQKRSSVLPLIRSKKYLIFPGLSERKLELMSWTASYPFNSGRREKKFVEIFDAAGHSRLALDKDVGMSGHVSAAVGDDRGLMSASPQFGGETRVEIGIVAYKKYLHYEGCLVLFLF